MTNDTNTDVRRCVEEISNVFNSVHRTVQQWITELQPLIVQSPLDASTLDAAVQELVEPELESNTELIGAGFVAAPHLLSDTPWHLAWWLGARNTFEASATGPSIRPLLTVEDPSADGFRDYTTLEWWRVPAESGHMHITGPYVDYLCTDDYTMTLTVPVRDGDHLLGMMGADQYVADVERHVLPLLQDSAHELTLVNASGRVMVSTDPSVATGMLLRMPGLTEALAARDAERTLDSGERVYACGATTLALIDHGRL